MRGFLTQHARWMGIYRDVPVRMGLATRLAPALRLAAIVTTLFISATTAAQVLTQTNTDLGHGFRFQESKQVNVKGRWHSDHSFKFLYHEKRFICQCSQFFISPTGRYAVFQDASNWQISRFKTSAQNSRVVHKQAKGKLIDVIWSKNEKHITLHIAEKPDAPDAIKKIRLGLR